VQSQKLAMNIHFNNILHTKEKLLERFLLNCIIIIVIRNPVPNHCSFFDLLLSYSTFPYGLFAKPFHHLHQNNLSFTTTLFPKTTKTLISHPNSTTNQLFTTSFCHINKSFDATLTKLVKKLEIYATSFFHLTI